MVLPADPPHVLVSMADTYKHKVSITDSVSIHTSGTALASATITLSTRLHQQHHVMTHDIDT